MASNFCLPQFAADLFKAKLKSGEINPGKLASMTSEERHAFFAKFLGEDVAKQVNANFESKLLLKSQQQGIINWAKKTAGLTPETRRDILAKVERMTQILQPAEEKAFLADLAEQRLGARVTSAEASKIAELAKSVETTKQAMADGGDRLEYGRARVAFGNYVSELKNKADSLSLQERLQPSNIVQNVSDVGGTMKSLKASLDNSAIFRQGWKTLFTHPKEWLRNSSQTFKDIVDTFGGKRVLDEVQAEIQSRPTYDLMRKAKVDTGTTEEAFPDATIGKVPLLGRAYKASEAAYTGFVYRQRADIFDKYIDIAKKAGVDVTDKKELESIGKLVNSLTGRGNLGSLERIGGELNNLFFSPRFLKSNIDFLTAHQAQKGVTPFVRKQAALNLAKVVAGTATILGIANAVRPGSVELDPRSSDFGKIKIGNTRFDVSGGMASILTLAARIVSQSSKSSLSHKITKIDDPKAYKGATTLSTAEDFLENKLAPLPRFLLDLRSGQTKFNSKPLNLTSGEGIKNIATETLLPIQYSNYEELQKDPNSANTLVSMIADALGIGTNTYGKK